MNPRTEATARALIADQAKTAPNCRGRHCAHDSHCTYVPPVPMPMVDRFPIDYWQRRFANPPAHPYRLEVTCSTVPVNAELVELLVSQYGRKNSRRLA